MSSGRKVTKADLLELARALGDEDVDEGESMLCIFQRALDRAREIGAPASTYPFGSDTAHPIVRDWARRVVDGAVEHVLSCRMGDNEAERFAAGWVDSAVRRHAGIDPATCSHTMKLGRCIRCGQTPGGDGPSVDEVIDLMHREPLPPLAMKEDRSLEQLAADGDLTPEDLSHLRPEANADRVQALLAEEPSWREPRERAEHWARTRGTRGAQLTG